MFPPLCLHQNVLFNVSQMTLTNPLQRSNSIPHIPPRNKGTNHHPNPHPQLAHFNPSQEGPRNEHITCINTEHFLQKREAADRRSWLLLILRLRRRRRRRKEYIISSSQYREPQRIEPELIRFCQYGCIIWVWIDGCCV